MTRGRDPTVHLIATEQQEGRGAQAPDGTCTPSKGARPDAPVNPTSVAVEKPGKWETHCPARLQPPGDLAGRLESRSLSGETQSPAKECDSHKGHLTHAEKRHRTMHSHSFPQIHRHTVFHQTLLL